MITVNPEKILFEDQNDVIDFVAVGLPPTKKNFDKVIAAIGREEGLPKLPKETISLSDDDLKAVLNRVYEVNKRNYTIGGIVAGTIILGLFGALIFSGNKEE